MNKEEANNFRLMSLINPGYVYNRIKGIRSLDELKKKAKDLIVLFLKLVTFRYGARYWERKRQENPANYMDEIDKIDEIGVHCEMGEYYFGRKDYEKALKIFYRILGLDKDNKTACFYIGDIKYVMAEYKESLVQYKKALELAKGNEEDESMLYSKIAQVYLKERDYALALEEIKKAIEYDKYNKYAYTTLGNIYAEKKEYEKALKEYNNALEPSKGDKKAESEIYSKIAQVYVEEGKYALALEKANKAIEYDEYNECAYKTLGNIYVEKKEYEKALKEYKKALALAKENKENESMIYTKIAQVYVEEGKYALALEEANKAIEYDEYNECAYKTLGNIYVEKKEYEKALKEYKKALALAKENKENESMIYTKIAQVYAEEGKYALALEEINKALEYDKNNKYICKQKKEYEKVLNEYKKTLELAKGNKEDESLKYSKLSQVYLEQGKYGLAIEEINKALEYDKNNENAYSMLGSIYRRERRYEAALGEFDKALKLSRGNKEYESGIYNETAQIYFKQGKYSRGMSELNKSKALSPQNSVTHFLMGSGYRQQGRYEEALKEFVRALGLARDDGETRKNIHFGIIKLVETANSSNNEKAVEIAKKALELNLSDNARLLNILTNELEIAQKAVKLKSKVRKLTVNLTNQCNLNCKMCCGQQTPKQEISWKVKEEIIKTFLYLEDVMWVGGEVFLDADFNRMLDEAIKCGVKQIITTNGLLLNEETARKFINNGIELAISIDGTTKEVYEDIRRGARYENMIEKLNMINRIRKEINPCYEITLNTVVMRSNYHQVEEFAEFAREHNFNNLNYIMVAENHNNENIFNFNRDKKVLSYIDRALDNARERCKEYAINFNSNITKGILQSSNEMKNSTITQYDENPLEPESSKEKTYKENNKAMCLVPWKIVNIDLLGNVNPLLSCSCKKVVGNLNESSMEEVWNGDEMVKYRESIVSGNIGEVCDLVKVYNRIPVELFK